MNNARKIWTPCVVLGVVILSTAYVTQIHGQRDESRILSHQEVAVRYAKARLDLAKADVQRANALAEKHLMPRLTLERVRSHLEIAKEQYRQATLASTGGPAKVRLRHAAERLRLAELFFDSGQSLNDSGSLSNLELKRLELKRDLARLNLQLVQDPGNVSTQMEYMQRQIDRFGEEILGLDERLSKLESRSPLGS